MKIESLRIENYRCFSDLLINFDARLTVLLGVNGSGKTTVLDAAAFLLQYYSAELFNQHIALAVSESDLKVGAESMRLSYMVFDESLPPAAERINGADLVLSSDKTESLEPI
jgi:predicted ATP-dependent endonuclease of OLD family